MLVYGVDKLIPFKGVKLILHLPRAMCSKLRICLDEMSSYEFVLVLGRVICVQRYFLLLCLPGGAVGKYKIPSVMNIFYH